MKLNRSYVISGTFATFLVGMLFGFQNCAKQQELQTQMNQNAASVTDTNKRLMDLETILTGMVEEEKQARIDADNALSKRVDEIAVDLANYQIQTNATLSSLQSLTTSQSNQITKNKSELETTINSSNEMLKGLIVTSNDGLQSQINSNLNKILSLQNESEEQKKSLIEQSNKISAMSISQEEFKAFVSTNYATKADLESLKELYDGLKIITKNLDLKIDYTKDEVLKVLSEDVNTLSSKLNTIELKTNSQGKEIETLKTDLSSAISEYKNSFLMMSSDFREEISNSEMKLGILIDQKNGNVRKEVLDQLKKESMMLALFTKNAVSEISNGIKELEKKVENIKSEKSQEKKDLEQQIGQLKKEMVEAIESEQIARSKIAADVELLTMRMKRAEDDLLEVRLMAEMNSKMISRISSSFEEEKKNVANRFQVQQTEIDQKLNSLKEDVSKSLQELAEKSESLVRNLGQDVQVQFKNLTTDIALLNSRQKNLEHNLKNFIEEYQTDKAKTVQFEQSLSKPKTEIITHLSNVIDSLSQLQLRFVKILAPDEMNKDFYDEDFKLIAKECKGVDEASFTNALGLDSFQILSIEYTRLLISGMRSGENERDKIFYDYGDIEDENSFSRTLALGLVKNSLGSEDQECLSKIQSWARGIILSDKRFKEIAKKLANDEEFERRIEVLYSSFNSIKDPATKIQNILEKLVIGLTDSKSAYGIIVSQTVIDLINGAWDQRMLSDRLAILDNFEDIQSGQTELAAEMKSGFSEIRNMLDNFKSTTNARLSSLEKEQGALKTSLKRALDVLISMNDRAGYQDLKAYTVWAGTAIDYTPQIYPNWKPEVNLVQHFFTGPKSLVNTSDSCTGNKILTTGGIQSYYQFGKWGPCWVNFRNIPITQWGNETKTLWLRVFGAGQLVNISIDSNKQKEAPNLFINYNFNRTFDFTNLTSLDPSLKFNGIYSKAVYDIKVPTLLDYYVKNIRTWGGITISVSTTKVDQIGSQVVKTNSNVFDYNIQLFSPLVIDFHKKSMPRTLSASESGVFFDHQANGVEKKSGWIAGHESAFLVKLSDKKKNRINGEDLFGEGTTINNVKAKNGFEALSYFDSNKDGFISAKDEIWNKLYAFFDYNQNAEIDSGELVKLNSTGIDRLDLNYSKISQEKGLQNGNDIRFMSKAFGEKNKMEANIYDVYFGVE